MPLRSKELSLVCAELHRHLTGAFAQKAFATHSRRVYLELRQPGRSTLLLLSVEPVVARLSVAEARVASETPTSFQKWLRRELIGAQLAAVEAHGHSVRLRFLSREGERALVGDLHQGQLILLGREGRVLSSSAEGPTPFAPGREYALSDSSADEQPSRLAPVDGEELPYARAADRLFEQTDRIKRSADARRRLLQPLKSRRARLARTVEKVRAEAARGQDAEAHRRFGELLAQNLHRVPRGKKDIELTEYTAEGVNTVCVPLDPALPPRDQAERHFQKYRRLLRAADVAGKRLVALEQELFEVDDQLAAISALSDEELQARAPKTAAAAPRKSARHVAFRVYFAKSGARILVGKTAADNDELTFHTARPFDLWLHARGLPGSHVVIPLDREAEVPQEVLLDAAHLALHHSPAKKDGAGEVAYTYAKFVRKPKDAPPGAVVYTREKVFRLKVESERMSRLLSTAEN